MSTTPIPSWLYVHDDLSEPLRAHGDGSSVWALGQRLFALLRREPHRVRILTLGEQLDALVACGRHAPFEATVGIGAAGARVAAQVHARTAWFPSIRRVDLWREEDADGGYHLAGPAPLESQLRGLDDARSIAITDDTLFSGLTLRVMLEALSPALRRRTHVFCLRAVAESVPEVASLAPVSVGFAAPGRILTEVSFINASGLVRRGAIRRTAAAPLAFFEREEWMAAWFPGYHQDVIAACRELASALEAPELLPR
jgi:hypothetical protein